MDASPLFLLILTIAANFLANTLPCSTRRLLSNGWAKIVVVYSLLLFGVIYTGGQGTSFGEAVKKSIPILLLFVLMTVCDVQYVALAIALLMVAHVLKTELGGGRIRGKSAERRARIAIDACATAATLTLCFGAAMYYRRQRRDHGRDWDWKTFFLSTECARGGR